MLEESGLPAPSVDPAARPVRRTYPAEYRARVLAEYEAAAHGEKSAVLRREGIYQTLVAEWVKARDAEAVGQTYRRVGKSRLKNATADARAGGEVGSGKRTAGPPVGPNPGGVRRNGLSRNPDYADVRIAVPGRGHFSVRSSA